MKPVSAHPPGKGKQPAKGPQPDPTQQQALAEKAANSQASVKARVESQNMPDKPPLDHQHTPNSSGQP